jgi:hypothetical protein
MKLGANIRAVGKGSQEDQKCICFASTYWFPPIRLQERETMKALIVTFFMLTACCSVLFSQIPNGNFEDWIIASNGGEVPAIWNSPFQNQPDAIFKSSDSFSGDYALGIATLNYSDNGSFAPAYFGVKIKPPSLENTLTFYYKIDSLDGDGKALVWIFKEDEHGDVDLLHDFSFNEVNENFVKEKISFTLPDLDSVLITFVSANQSSFIGYIGYTRILFDSVELSPASLVENENPDDDLIVYPNPAKGYFEIKNLHQDHQYLEIISTSGQTIHEENIKDKGVHIGSTGFFFINIYDRKRELLKTLKLFNF